MELMDVEIALFGEEFEHVKSRLSYDPRMEAMLNVAEKNINDSNLSANTVACACHMGEHNLDTLLRFYLKMSFSGFLSRYRVYRAAVAFSARNDSVLNVAGDVGISQSTLERYCRKYLKLTPVDLRARFRHNFRRIA